MRDSFQRYVGETHEDSSTTTKVMGTTRRSREDSQGLRDSLERRDSRSWVFEIEINARVFACVFVTELSSTPSNRFPTKVACTPSWPGAGHTLRVTSSASNEVTSSS